MPGWVAAQDRVAPLDRVDERVFSSREGAAGETMVTGGHLVSGAVPGSVAGLATRVRQGSKSQLDYEFSRASLPSLSAAHAGSQYSLQCTRLDPVVVVPIKDHVLQPSARFFRTAELPEPISRLNEGIFAHVDFEDVGSWPHPHRGS